MTSFLTDYIAKQLEKVLKDYLVDFSTGNISKVSMLAADFSLTDYIFS